MVSISSWLPSLCQAFFAWWLQISWHLMSITWRREFVPLLSCHSVHLLLVTACPYYGLGLLNTVSQFMHTVVWSTAGSLTVDHSALVLSMVWGLYHSENSSKLLNIKFNSLTTVLKHMPWRTVYIYFVYHWCVFIFISSLFCHQQMYSLYVWKIKIT